MNLDEKVLAYALCNKSLAIKVIDKINPKFIKPEYRPFLTATKECIKKYNEVPTLEMLQRSDVWDDGLGELYNELKEIKEELEPTNFLLDYEDLKERYKKNIILKAGKAVFKENWNGNDFNDLKEAAKEIRKLAGELEQTEVDKTYKEGTISATAEEAKAEYIKRKENPEEARGLLTGINEFDRITNGLQPSELVLIGGESGSGKSTLSMNIAMNCWLGSNKIGNPGEPFVEFATDGCNVIYFTIEMPFSSLRRRLDACIAEIPLYGLRDGTLTQEEEQKYFRSLEFQQLYNKSFYIVDIPRKCTPEQIETCYLESCDSFIPSLIVVDYIGIMSGGDGENDWLSQGVIAEKLHEIARTYNITIISPVQLNRPKDSSEPPSQHRISRSSLISANSNIMLNIHTRQNEHLLPNMSINIAKMRDGEGGGFLLGKRFDIMRLYNINENNWEGIEN